MCREEGKLRASVAKLSSASDCANILRRIEFVMPLIAEYIFGVGNSPQCVIAHAGGAANRWCVNGGQLRSWEKTPCRRRGYGGACGHLIKKKTTRCAEHLACVGIYSDPGRPGFTNRGRAARASLRRLFTRVWRPSRSRRHNRRSGKIRWQRICSSALPSAIPGSPGLF